MLDNKSPNLFSEYFGHKIFKCYCTITFYCTWLLSSPECKLLCGYYCMFFNSVVGNHYASFTNVTTDMLAVCDFLSVTEQY